jgi:hypothetical protein
LQTSPFLCTFCGQSAGQATPEQLYAIRQQRAQERQARRIAAAERAEQNRERRAKTGAQLGQVAAETSAQLGRVAVELASTSMREVKNLPARTDGMLRIIAGKDNDIIFWFLRILAVLFVVGSLIGIGFFLVSLFVSVVS